MWNPGCSSQPRSRTKTETTDILKTVESISACGIQVVALNQVLNIEFENASLSIINPLKTNSFQGVTYHTKSKVILDFIETVNVKSKFLKLPRLFLDVHTQKQLLLI
jgi:hypothetical protein